MGVWSLFNGSYDRASHGNSATSRRFRYPQSHEEWEARYNWLWEGYAGDPYDLNAIKELSLFRALDRRGNEIAYTKRVTRDIQHVVNTDARALSGRLVLANANDSAASSAMEVAAKAVWARSRIIQRLETWAVTGSALGSVFVEAVRMNGTRPHDTTLVAYDPRCVHAVYDDTGTRIERVFITADTFESPAVVNGRLVDMGRDGALDTYVREVDAEMVRVYRDGRLVDEESGPHGAGVIPVVHMPFVPILVDPAHGMWAAQGLDMALAMVDSMLEQVKAIGNRHANPTPVLIGSSFKESNGPKFGHAISGLPLGADYKLVEANMSGVGVLLDAVEQAREQARATLPEFLFTRAGASASGAALNFWASAFVAKMESVRARWFSSLVEVTQIAVAMDQGTTADLEPMIDINAPPILPVAADQELVTVLKALEAGVMKRRDAIRHMQRLDLVPPDVDVDEYLIQVTQERAEDDARLAALVQGGAGEPSIEVGE